MKKLRKFMSVLSMLLLITIFTTGCQKGDPKVEVPFTSITWENTLDDIKELEGECKDSYDSIYDGTTYTYPKEYKDANGTVKYMFDDKDKLVSMSWYYQPADSEELHKLFDSIQKELTKKYGKSGFKYKTDKYDKVTSPADVWYRKDGNISLNTVDTNDMRIIQFTFMHPSVSDN